MTTQADLDKQAKAWTDANKEIDEQESKGTQVAGLGDIIKKGARALLGSGTAKDATADGQEAYRQHVLDAAGSGDTPMSREEWAKSRASTKA